MYLFLYTNKTVEIPNDYTMYFMLSSRIKYKTAYLQLISFIGLLI